LQGADLRGANIEGANFGTAYLRGADLRGANLEGANFGGAILEGVDLEGAYFEGANFEGVKGAVLPSIFICGTKHNFFYMNGKIRIGCEEHPVKYWLENYKSIGKINNYSDDQVNEYYQYIKFCIDIKGEE